MLDPDYTTWSPAAVYTPDNPDRMSHAELAAHVATLPADPQAAYLLGDTIAPRLATLRRQLPPYNAPPSPWFLGIEAARGAKR